MGITMGNTLIIIPAYNVGKHLMPLLQELDRYKENCIVIDDGSTDDTNKIINRERFNYIGVKNNLGLSNAVAVGLEYAISAGYENVVLMDADGQHNPKDLDEFLDALHDFDMVFGNRFKYRNFIPTCKIVSNAFASMLYYDICGYYIPDIACGYKGFKISKELFDYIRPAKDYSIIYRIVNYAIIKKMSLHCISTDAIYYNDNLLFTRTNELASLLSSALELSNVKNFSKEIGKSIEEVLCNITYSRNFEIKLCKTKYFAYYLNEYDGYIIQSSLININNYYERGI